MMDRSQPYTDLAASIVTEALQHTAERFSRFPLLQRMLAESEVKAVAGTPAGVRAVAPGDGSPRGRIEYDPEHMLQLAREHRHPEWVVCACIERLILARIDSWEPDETERQLLVAHRELRRSRTSRDGMGPDS